MKYRRIYLLVIVLNCFIISLNAQMNGTYLIGPTQTYKTINQAVLAVSQAGVMGPVYFSIENGVYNEQISIPYIKGTSLYNLVTFQSLSADNSKVIIKFKPKNDTFNYTLSLNGARYIVFKNLTISTDTISGRIIDINNRCSANQFINNRFVGMIGGKELVYSPSTSNSNDNNNWFVNNLFHNGSVGISFYGVDTTIVEQGNELINNNFIDQSQQAIDLKYNHTFIIQGNIISSVVGLFNYTGIRIQYCKNKFNITKNKFEINNLSKTCSGIAILFSNDTSLLSASNISNNFIHITTNYYTYVSGFEIRSNFKNFYFNSVNITGNNDASFAFNEILSSNLNIYNNIFSNQTNGISLLLNDTINIVCDYNSIYSKGIAITSDGTNDYTTLASWRTASKHDLNSISTDPLYLSNSDLHINNFRLSKRGITISTITDDIDGNKRKSPKPDIGADEFTYKLGLGPDKYICAGSSVTLSADKGFDNYLWSNSSTSNSITIDSTGIGVGVKQFKLSVSYQTDNYSDSVLVHFIKAHASLGADKAVCEYEPVTLQASGGVKFKWNTKDTSSAINIIAKKSSRYYVLVTDQYGCIDSTSIWVSVKPRPSKPTIILIGTDSLQSSVVGTQYKWFLEKSILPDNKISIKAKTDGTYKLIVFDSLCPSDSSDGYYYKKNSIDNSFNGKQIRLYPNPVTNILIVDVIDFDLSGSEIEIISTLGEKIFYSNQLYSKIEIETSTYKKGMYILKFINKGQTLVRRFLVQ